VIASILPKELLVKEERLEDMADAEFFELLDAVRNLVAGAALSLGNKDDQPLGEITKSPS
jgi:hypothetical protein